MDTPDHRCPRCGRSHHGTARRLDHDDDRCPNCRQTACICPSLEEVPYGHMPGEPGYRA